MQRCEGVEGLLRSKSLNESSDVFLWKVLYRKKASRMRIHWEAMVEDVKRKNGLGKMPSHINRMSTGNTGA